MKRHRQEKNISPFFFKDDHTRIRLANDDDGDYINASKIVSLLKKNNKKCRFNFSRIRIQNANISLRKGQCQIQQMHFGKWFGNKNHVLLLH
jgi:hypothetical protein